MSVIGQHVEGEEDNEASVIRTCGKSVTEKYPVNECYTTVLEEYNTEVCSCSEDGCNSASM